MTKNEMQRECEQCVEDCLHARFDVGVGNIDAEEWNEKVAAKNTAFDAYALADTLGMLEEIAKLQDSVVIYLHDGQTALEVWQHKGPGMEFRYQKQGRITPCHEENITRAEAEALLAGEEKKG